MRTEESQSLRSPEKQQSKNLSEAALTLYISQQDITQTSTLLQQLLLVYRALWLEAGKTGK